LSALTFEKDKKGYERHPSIPTIDRKKQIDTNMTKLFAHLKQPVKFGGAQHVAAGTGEVAWAVANPYGSDGLAFASCELQDKFALLFGLRLKDLEWRASVCEPPIGEFSFWRRLGDGDGVETVIKGL
jgi:hypothetical protein